MKFFVEIRKKDSSDGFLELKICVAIDIYILSKSSCGEPELPVPLILPPLIGHGALQPTGV